jgi:carbon storage regulator CsrA
MLVLSRRLNEKILLPKTNTIVQVVAIKPGVVRIGIDAPPDVIILREELQNRGTDWAPAEPAQPRADAGSAKLRTVLHQVRDQLKAATMGLGLLQLQLDMCDMEDAKATLANLREAFQVLHCGVDGELEPLPAQPSDRATKMEKIEDAAPVEDESEVVEEWEGQLCGV